MRTQREQIRTDTLDVAIERTGPGAGWPVVLLHGFPYDVRAFDAVVGPLAAAGADVIVPYLRGYGHTRFRSADTMRSGQQAALGQDLLELIEALSLDQPILAGYDWGGRAACIVAALWPERIAGLVTVNGYNIQHIASSGQPIDPARERSLWYQYYLHGERGRRGLSLNRAAFARQLWHEWSPLWRFTEAEFEASAASFDNPDFVDVVVHSYRHRYGLVGGDPAYQPIEDGLAEQPAIAVPSIVLDGENDTVNPPQDRAVHATHFHRLIDYRQVPAGHNVPQETPQEFARAVLDLRRTQPAS